MGQRHHAESTHGRPQRVIESAVLNPSEGLCTEPDPVGELESRDTLKVMPSEVICRSYRMLGPGPCSSDPAGRISDRWETGCRITAMSQECNTCKPRLKSVLPGRAAQIGQSWLLSRDAQQPIPPEMPGRRDTELVHRQPDPFHVRTTTKSPGRTSQCMAYGVHQR